MKSARDYLREALEHLSDDDAQRLLALIREIDGGRTASSPLDRLAADPALQVPTQAEQAFRRIQPTYVGRRPASEALIEDRR